MFLSFLVQLFYIFCQCILTVSQEYTGLRISDIPANLLIFVNYILRKLLVKKFFKNYAKYRSSSRKTCVKIRTEVACLERKCLFTQIAANPFFLYIKLKILIMTVSECFNNKKKRNSSVKMSSTLNCFRALFRHQVVTQNSAVGLCLVPGSGSRDASPALPGDCDTLRCSGWGNSGGV